ncbi:hypothetical protein BKI52_33150 [marine bacterium AO1-C]|nr:hypothetical protein BKI52_33150 [marine bacterium AO1-C]
MNYLLFNRGKPILYALIGLCLMLGMSSCSEFGKGIYAYKLKQGRDSLEKKFPELLFKMVVDQDGNYQLVSPRKGLIKFAKLRRFTQSRDTVFWELRPDYDYLETTLYNFGVKQAEKLKKLKVKDTLETTHRPRDGLK